MKISEIVKRVNRLLAGEILSYDELIIHLDATVDIINTELSSIFPAFSELESGEDSYDFFPDKYIRSVLCLGAAVSFYITDEEGSTAPQMFSQMFENNLFMMKRDYLQFVPAEFVADPATSVIPVDVNIETPVHPGSFTL